MQPVGKGINEMTASDLSPSDSATEASTNTGFLRSKYFYISLVIAFSGAQMDWVLTAIGLVLGFTETRPFFWLHAVALFAVIIVMYTIFYNRHPRMTNYLSMVFAAASPAVPVISNVAVLATGQSPFV
jgi:hypothetical protein